MNSRIRSFVFMAIVCGCVLFFQWAYAQQTQPSKQKGSSPPATAQKEPSPPSPEQQEPAMPPIEKDLSFLLGKWETKVKIYPNEFRANKEEVKGAGTSDYHLFGKTIEGSMKSESNVGNFEAREFIFPNPSESTYEILTVSANGNVSNRKLAKVGDHWEVTYSGKRALAGASDKKGKDVEFSVRGKYKIVSDKEVHYTSEINFGKTGFKPFIELLMTRVP